MNDDMTNARFLIHMDAGTDDVVWWAESSDVPGLSVAAETLTELRRLIFDSVEIHLGSTVDVTMHLAEHEAPTSRTEAVEAGAVPSASHAAAVGEFLRSRFAA